MNELNIVDQPKYDKSMLYASLLLPIISLVIGLNMDSLIGLAFFIIILLACIFSLIGSITLLTMCRKDKVEYGNPPVLRGLSAVFIFLSCLALVGEIIHSVEA